MAKLIYSMGGTFIDEFSLDKNRLTIGRRPNNDIHIDNLAVSGEHAVIMTIGNDSFLEDVGSTNGTLVNGKIIKKHVLQHGDVVEFGKFQLKYVNEEAALQAANGGVDDFEKTMIIRPAAKVPAMSAAPTTIQVDAKSTATAKSTTSSTALPKVQAIKPAITPPVTLNQPITISAAPSATSMASIAAVSIAKVAMSSTSSAEQAQKPLSSAPPLPSVPPAVTTSEPMANLSAAPINHAASQNAAVGHIQVLSGASAGKELMLNKALTTLGKPGVQVAVITKRPQGYFITHVEGAIHPIINGKSAGAQAHQLNDNDVIELAGVKMQFYLFKAG